MRISRRTTGRLLIAYAILGFVLVAFGAFTGLELAAQVERLSGTADEALSAAARATEAAADSFTAVDGSLSDAQTSADAAAGLAREAAGSLRSLAAAMDVSILGTQPLQGLAAAFETNAGQADALAGTLDAVGGSLGDTRTEVALIGPELSSLSEELRTLGTEPEAAAAAPGLRLFVVLLLVWLVMQAFASLVAGLVLLRSPADA
jgi:phage-related tail protein